jgi:hypothetical protein
MNVIYFIRLPVKEVLHLQKSASFSGHKNPPFLHILGCGHTGSSILARVLGEHSKVYFVPIEIGMYLANRYFEESEHRNRLSAEAIEYGANIVLEKTPRHIWHQDYIRRKYPGTRFIVTTRDGREVIASLYERYGDWDAACARYLDDSILSLRQVNMPDTKVVRYEDFVMSPVGVIEKIYFWLNLSYETNVLNYYENPLEWNLSNPYQADGAPSEHDLRRNLQVNSRIQPLEYKWHDRVPPDLHSSMNALFSGNGYGRRIMQDFGYEI